MQQYDYLCSDDEDYGINELDYSEGSSSELDVNLENQYYNGKSLKNEHPREALSAFQNVVDLEDGNLGDWGFKALKQMVKINFKIGEYESAIKNYKKLLGYIKNAVTRNKGEKSINSLLDCISNSKDVSLLQDFYKTTLAALKDTKNPRLWFKCNIKLGKIYFERKEYAKLIKLIKELHDFCNSNQDEDECCKGTQLLEIYALEIQFYTEQKNLKALKTLYRDALKIKSAIPHPLIMSIIRECGGKMHLKAGDYEEARTDFFEAFKNYDEAGNTRRTHCLKYFILASMLLKTNINPLDSQEAKAYKNDPDIVLMTQLVTAYQNGEMETFQKILRENDNIMEDDVLEEYFEELLRNMRVRDLMQTIKPYKNIRIAYICNRLNIDTSEAESLLISCILDGTIKGRIDQMNQVLVLRPIESQTNYEAINKWSYSLHKFCTNFDSF